MDEQITMLDPDTSQFTTMLMKVKHPSYDGALIHWLDDELMPRVTATYWTNQLWGDWQWFDPWTTESDRRKAWEHRRDEAIKRFTPFVSVPTLWNE